MQVLWAATHSGRHEDQSEESQCHKENGCISVWEGTGGLPGYGELPKLILQQTHIGDRTNEGTPEKWQTMVLESTNREAFETIWEKLTKTPVLAYFNPKAEYVIQMDSSMKGLGVVLLQKGRLVIYMSRTLTPAEIGFSNIEREVLSIIFGLERLHYYIFGRKVEVQTDQMPLIPIWRKSIAATSPQLQWILLWLAKYNVELTYLKGKDNVIADALCCVSSWKPEAADKDDIIPVHHITSEVSAIESQLERVRVVTHADPVLSQLKHQIFQGWPYVQRHFLESIHLFWNYRDELVVKDGLIFKAHKLVIRESQIYEFLKDLHVGYFREEKTLRRATECIYWPGITGDIKEYIKGCNYASQQNPANKRSSHPTKCTETTMGEGWEWHFPIWVLWILSGGRLFQQLLANHIFEQPNGSQCNTHLENDVLSAWDTSICIHRPRETIHIWCNLRVCKVLQDWDTSLNTEILTMKWVHWMNGEGHEADNDLAMLAYWVTLSGPGKHSPVEAMTKHKFRALLLIKQHLSAQ